MSSTKSMSIKTDKKESLLKSAMEIFKTKGITNTTVADIAKYAGTAKGTFYLYFKDKDEIIRTIIMNEASKLLENAINLSKNLKTEKASDKVIFVANELMNAFLENIKYVEIIHKNLYTGLFSKSDNDVFSNAVKEFVANGKEKDTVKAEKKLYIIIEMVGGVFYNSITNNEPYCLDDIKDELFECIRSIVDN